MVPLVKATVKRLLNEPVAALGLLSSLAVVFNDQIPMPTWAQATALALFSFAARSVVKGPQS